jgi:DNA repair ATPase RecN
MYIKSLKLINFQKHEDLQIDFVHGVNILYGQSDAGKSCIRRAIEWITQNENIDGIRKTGTKKTSVSIILDNNIEIERIRSQSINRYIIRKDSDEKTFDAVGRSIPDEVKEVLTIYPIGIDEEEIYLNSQPQIGLPFLFDKSPSFRMKLFNKLTGNDVLDKLFSEFNKDILRIKRNKKEETELFENRAIELKNKKIEMEKAEAIHARLKKRVQNIKQLYEKYSNLLQLKELSGTNKKNKENVEKALKKIKIPEDIDIKRVKANIERFDHLKTLKNAFEKAESGISRVSSQIKDIRIPQVNLATLNDKIQRFDTIKLIYEKISQNRELFSLNQRKSKILQKDTENCINRYKALLKEIKVCPICKTVCTEEHLKDIKL